MCTFLYDVCQSSWLWKLALLFGLCGLGGSLAGLVTPNFVVAENLNGTQFAKFGLFEVCVSPFDDDSWYCETYPKSREKIYMLISRYICLGAVVCGLFGVGSHFLSPLHRPYFKVKHSIYYYASAVVTAIVGSVVFVHYKMNDEDVWDSPEEKKPFTANVFWSLYAYIAAAVIFVVAAIFCGLEVRRSHRERRQGNSYMMSSTT